MNRLAIRLLLCELAVAALVVLALAATGSSAMGPADAILLGVVEGITEFLPVSSTGHLLVVGRLLGLGDGAERDPLDTYVIAIQVGAIAAVVALYRDRLCQLARGALGSDADGRILLGRLIMAFIPAALIGVVFESQIKRHLFAPWPIVIAWACGGVVLLAWNPTARPRAAGIVGISCRQATVIGLAQTLALWPGVSRSLVTILAALGVGLAIEAAVEFSFLLGLATLTAATAWDLLRNGDALVEAFGWRTPLLGALAAFLSAMVSVRWMVTYLRRHPLRLFGWYRIAAAATTALLLATGAV